MKNEKFEETLKSIWGSLTDGQKAKINDCKTMDELIELAGKEGVELPDEVMNKIAGGAIYPAEEKGGWWLIRDHDGQTQTIVYGSEDYAKFEARRMGFSDKILTTEEYEDLKGCL